MLIFRYSMPNRRHYWLPCLLAILGIAACSSAPPPPPAPPKPAPVVVAPPPAPAPRPTAPPLPGLGAQERWLLVDTATATLSVMQGEHAIASFTDMAIGRFGLQAVHFKDDNSTPAGIYRIDGINTQSRYSLFFSLNYPTHEHARKALEMGRITREQYLRIFNAEMQGQPPPYDTPLGGMIGIHGLGNANPELHRTFNWTKGCVALDNGQIRALAGYIKVGMRVLVR